MRRFASLLALASVALATGCSDHRHDGGDYGGGGPGNGLSTAPETAPIDTGATIEPHPGDGVGAFVTYAAGGHWTLSTACDTNTSQLSCAFDLYVRPVDESATLSNPKGQGLTGPDAVDLSSDGSFHLFAATSTDTPGLTFDATPGSAVQLEMYLDGAPQPRFVYWVGKGILHTGAPTDPMNLAPSAP
jgi:hypothetical protein